MKYFESLYPADSMRDEVEKAMRLIEAGNFVQAVGLPGTGKSTLLRLLAYNAGVQKRYLAEKGDDYLFVYMNFTEVGKRNIRDVTKYMLLNLHEALLGKDKQGAGFVKEKLHAAIELNDEMVFFQNLKLSIEYLASKGVKTVFLIDRLEYYYSYMDERFFVNLRILRNSAKYAFSVVFSLGRPLDMVLEQKMISEVYDLVVGNTVFVGIKHPEGLEFRMKHLEEKLRKSCDEEVKQEIIRLTGGHGKLTKIGYEAVLSEGCETSGLEDFLLARRQIKGALGEIWGYFTSEEQKALLEINKNTTFQQAQTIKGEAVKFLSSLGIISEGKITIPLFEKYIEDKKSEVVGLSYLPEKRVIMRGGDDITEIFSPREFRLLNYLLERPGVIIGRDEIIDYVWEDTATREGVSPEAFDQMVYRVRKKIEVDPSAPQMLTTVKGRGYKMRS